MATLTDLYNIVNTAIDIAFTQEKYHLNFYEYLRSESFKKEQVMSFLNSSLAVAIVHQIEELNLYLNDDGVYSFIKESYDWMGQSRAEKTKEYLKKILDDAEKYEKSKRRGRKPKTTSTSTNK
jgi:hypothetical protein